MTTGPGIANIGALMGDPARANMLTALMSGQALTASELAHVAGIAAPTASGHLAQLLAGCLLVVEKQGRHRYYRLAGPEVAAAIEALMDLSELSSGRRLRPGPRNPELRRARVCYDHLAGERGVALFARLVQRKLITLEDGAIAIARPGEREFADFGIDVADLRTGKRPVCRTCLDWSERRSHLAGTLGAHLLNRIFDLGWARRVEGSRIVRFTSRGEKCFSGLFQ